MLKFFITIIFGFFSNFLYAENLEKVWTDSTVYSPNSWFSINPTHISSDKKYPVVIYLHGCTGITLHDDSWARFISNQGFIVFLPDSFAYNRQQNCNTKSYAGGGYQGNVYELRIREAEYVLNKVLQFPWVNKESIFLMGHSEGGQAASRSNIKGIKGYIVSGWTCTNWYNTNNHGLKTPKEAPVLAIAYNNDPWRTAYPGTVGRCADNADGRFITQIDLIGAFHETFSSLAAREAVKLFLKQHL